MKPKSSWSEKCAIYLSIKAKKKLQVLYILVCIRSVLKDNNSTDQMLKYTSFYAVKGQYTQQGCKQDRFCTIQPYAHCTLTSNSNTVPLILSNIYSFEFPWAERTFRKKKNILSHAISALFRQCVFISGQQILLFCLMPSCLSGILTMCPMPVVPWYTGYRSIGLQETKLPI